MSIEDIFWIGAPPGAKLTNAQRAAARKAPGVVLTGEVVGTGTLKPGDFMISDESRFEIMRIEAFRENLDTVEPPRNVGLVLGAQVDKDFFRKGHQVRFAR
jgi:hypothetical protein